MVTQGKRKYNRFRDFQLTLALQEAKADVEAGRYKTESVEEHMQRLADDLSNCLGKGSSRE